MTGSEAVPGPGTGAAPGTGPGAAPGTGPGTWPGTSRGSALRAALDRARLYLCTDARERQGDLAGFLDAVLANGVDIVQLRQKGLEARRELAHLEVFRDACARHQRLLAVNDRADVARAAHADVLHLGQDDLPVPVAREIVGDERIIGRSTHTPGQVARASAEPGVDYFCVGPVRATPTKPGRPAAGAGLVSYTASSLGSSLGSSPGSSHGQSSRHPARPWFAIGGIDLSNLGEVLDRGARRVVVVRAITEADDPGAAAAAFARRLRDAAGA